MYLFSCFQIRYIIQTQGNVGIVDLLNAGTKVSRFFKKVFVGMGVQYEWKLKVNTLI